MPKKISKKTKTIKRPAKEATKKTPKKSAYLKKIKKGKKIKKKPKVRLSAHVVPERYRLMLRPDLVNFVFEGEEIISLILTKETKELTLHCVDLRLEDVSFFQNGKEYLPEETLFDLAAETVTFTFPVKLKKGKGELSMKFFGELTDKMRGFYRSKYEVNGEVRHLATTQFEATDARRAFPCFDEPALKAVFDVTLVTPGTATAISNTMPIAEPKHEGDWTIVEFEPTPKMSTYLLAFIVGEFEVLEGKTPEGTLVRIFTTPGKIHQAEFALYTAMKCLSFYNYYFDIPYPLPVLDLIAVPDFAMGAMENWGAITYRETALLFDEAHSSIKNKQRVAIVIAHELAHQWFGNLVTMEWWTDLWLNEGFASYIEYLAVDEIFPEWDMWTHFLSSEVGRALRLDSLANTHAIEIPVHHPDEIGEIFDVVSYSKGAAVIRMLADYLGKADFRDGLRHYLKKHSYANTLTVDLWDAFEFISKKPVRKIMKKWTQMAGYPVLTMKDKKEKFEITQSRFFLSPLSQKKMKDSTLWPVPYGEKLSDKKTFEIVKEKMSINEAGFFRVAYTPAVYAHIKTEIEKGNMSTHQRLSVIRDLFALAEAGKVHTSEALTVAEAFTFESNYVVWFELLHGLEKLYSVVYHEKFAGELRAFACGLLKDATKKIGWQKVVGESDNDSLLRPLLLMASGMFGDRDTLIEAKKLFQEFMKTGLHLPADIRAVVYSLASLHGSEKEFNALVDLYVKEKLHEEKGRIGRALGFFDQKHLIEKALAFSIGPDVRSQDSLSILASIFENPHARDIAWRFVKKNWNLFVERYGKGVRIMSNVVDIFAIFTTKEKAMEVETFFKTHSAPSAERALAQALESIHSKALWLERDREDIQKHLKRVY